MPLRRPTALPVLLLFIVACLTTWSPALAEPVISLGWAPTDRDATEHTLQDQAVEEGLRSVLGQTLAELLGAKRLEGSLALVAKPILAQPGALINGFRILTTYRTENRVYVLLQAEVNRPALKAMLTKIGLGRRALRLKILPLVSVQIGQNKPFAWWLTPGLKPPDSRGLTALLDKLRELGLTVLPYDVDQALAAGPDPTPAEAAALGRRYGAEMVLVGRIVEMATDQGPKIRAQIKLVEAVDGQIVVGPLDLAVPEPMLPEEAAKYLPKPEETSSGAGQATTPPGETKVDQPAPAGGEEAKAVAPTPPTTESAQTAPAVETETGTPAAQISRPGAEGSDATAPTGEQPAATGPTQSAGQTPAPAEPEFKPPVPPLEMMGVTEPSKLFPGTPPLAQARSAAPEGALDEGTATVKLVTPPWGNPEVWPPPVPAQEAGTRLADLLAQRLEAAGWVLPVKPRQVTITLDGVKRYIDLKFFLDTLAALPEQVQEVKQQAIQAGRAKFTARLMTTPDKLADLLQTRDYPTFFIEVVKVDQNALDLRLAPK